MLPHLFWSAAFTELPTYIYYFLISVLFHWLLFRKYILSILDPMFMIAMGFTFSSATLFFVFSVSDMSRSSLLAIISMQLTGYIGFLFFAPRKTKMKQIFSRTNSINTPLALDFSYTVLTIGFIVFLCSTVLQYYLVGIPLLQESRLGLFAGSGGWGVIERFHNICSVFAAIFIVRLMLSPKASSVKLKLLRYISFVIYLVIQLLSGSKAAVLGFVQLLYILYACKYFNNNKFLPRILTVRTFALGCLLLLSPFVALYIHPSEGGIFDELSDSKIMMVLFSFLYRLANSGDIYIYYFVDNAFASIPNTDGLLSLFSGMLTTFRILDPADVPLPLGFELAKLAAQSFDTTVTGPNSFASVFGFHYFGVVFGLFFSLIMGCLMGLGRHVFISAVPGLIFKVSKTNFAFSISLFTLGSIGLTTLADPLIVVSGMASLVIVIPVIVTLTLALWFAQDRKITLLR